jgi:hypothetical protein
VVADVPSTIHRGGYAPSTIIENGITNALVNGRSGKGMVVVLLQVMKTIHIQISRSWNPQILVVGALSPCGEKSRSSCDGENWWGSCYESARHYGSRCENAYRQTGRQ